MDIEDKSKNFATFAHAGQTRRDGETPYITHPSRVVDRLRRKGVSGKLIAVAWMHDVLEDTPYTSEMMLAAGIPADVIQSVEALTKTKGESYQEYLTRVASNDLARIVKIEDILDNLSDTPSDRQIKKYAKALIYLLP